MNAVARTQIESRIVDRFGHVFERQEKRPREILSTGIAEIDQVLCGFPRGAITELHGGASCGRTSLMVATLAAASANEETCALIDCSDTFDVSSAASAGVSLERLLWIRCDNNLERAFKAVDLLLHGGGFGLVALSLADMPARSLRRIISTWWFRFRRAIENTPTVLLVMTPVACLRSCAAMAFELKHEGTAWPGTDSSRNEERRQPHVMRMERPPVHLSLVANHSSSLRITHSHFLRASSIRVNRERPLTAAGSAIRFSAHS
jgi:recA bacterial DNA recombination protein